MSAFNMNGVPDAPVFKEWSALRDLTRYGIWRFDPDIPTQAAKHEALIQSGFAASTAPPANYYVRMADSAAYLWLEPTTAGRIALATYAAMREHRCAADEARKQGRYDAVTAIAQKLYDLAGIDPDEYTAED